MVEKYLLGKHILIAEDNVTNQVVVTKMIEHLGATFDLAENGQVAIDLFEPNKYDLALLDIEMPKKSGLEVIRYIRSCENTTASFPVVALTAYVLNEHRAKILDAGATSIIAKPIIDIEKFGETLQFVLNMSIPIKKSVSFIVDEDRLNHMALILGPDATKELIENLESDLSKIHDNFRACQSDLDREMVRSNAHSLLSLTGISGAETLKETTQNMHDFYDELSDAELKSGIDDILSGIVSLQKHITEKFGKRV